MIATVRNIWLVVLCISALPVLAQTNTTVVSIRERLLLDSGWRFAFGHPYNTDKDFGHATGYFSYLAKAGYADGPADAAFDDRAWRKLSLPHDWAAEQDFSPQGSFSHGFKQVGRHFPDKSIGWYRKAFHVTSAELGRRITVAFDGVFRNATVWINGHFLGVESSGYSSFEYDITDYINYGGNNVLAVRVDATMEEGWFYEGAGIYRHVWLVKTAPLHVAANGVVVNTTLENNAAQVQAGVTIQNDALQGKMCAVKVAVVDAAGKTVATAWKEGVEVAALQHKEIALALRVTDARLWELDNPYLYKLVTTVLAEGKETDVTTTSFGIRTIRFDAATGFFLNDKPVKLKGTNNHQDHAGVGTAIPDALVDYRIQALKDMGANAYRCSHHPPAPELLDACDRLGMLVIDETRLMGTSGQPLQDLKRMIVRDRNHPSIFCWSVGNEEWRIENGETGARMATTLQAYAKSLDSTRYTTAGISGGFASGISDVLEVMGYNYLGNGDIEAHHKRFPQQPGMGTEEGSTFATRGVYVNDTARQYMAAYDRKPRPSFYSIEEGWRFYADRPYLAGLFIWTGFDYRGEPTPFGWPSVNSYFGMMDICGFPKDDYYYLQSWWSNKPVLHLLPHWNWAGKEGQLIDVWAYSNCDEVELLVNRKSQGKKRMTRNGHLEWKVPYVPGVLEAVGYKNGKAVLWEKRITAQAPAVITLAAHKPAVVANGSDVAVVTVGVTDAQGHVVPMADNDITFALSGPGRIIGVGNGNPTSLEKEQFLDEITNLPVQQVERKNTEDKKEFVYKGQFMLPAVLDSTDITFFYKSIGSIQSVTVNGVVLAKDIALNAAGNVFLLNKSVIKPGMNEVLITGKPIAKLHDWDVVNTDAGVVQVLRYAVSWKRKLFNGAAQVIIQAAGPAGNIQLKASGKGLTPAVLTIPSL
ncbi:beta-galactosidase [Filimonas lacunae]|uniref:Beta-galactosidase n=1 Tax=Filimonas lacunae TaxID=477680 RepID=A0A173M978_9BACT|nr:beta-galactosidase GalA [Filimonas lacunae]BAV04096.1 beta-galactosidase [Filimonas lacunae]SIT15498.1 beta-galactosidase [Filimonas lacunae]